MMCVVAVGVHPHQQGRGLGSQLFMSLLNKVGRGEGGVRSRNRISTQREGEEQL